MSFLAPVNPLRALSLCIFDMNPWRTLVRLTALAAALASAGFAVDWKALKFQGYVNDFAGVIDAQSRASLEDYAGRVEQSTGAQLAFVTVASTQGEPIEDAANTIFRSWGVGHKKEDDGAMMVLSIQDRKSRLEVGGGLGSPFPMAWPACCWMKCGPLCAPASTVKPCWWRPSVWVRPSPNPKA